jgi:hypothetical protein
MHEKLEEAYIGGEYQPLVLDFSDYTGDFKIEPSENPKIAIQLVKAEVIINKKSVVVNDADRQELFSRIENLTMYTEQDMGMILFTEGKGLDVRYFLVGVPDEETNIKAGIIYDYTGGGEYTTAYVLGGEILSIDDCDDDALIDIIDTTVGKGFIDMCEAFMAKHMHYNPEEDSYSPILETDKRTVYIGKKVSPMDFGNTLWEEN